MSKMTIFMFRLLRLTKNAVTIRSPSRDNAGYHVRFSDFRRKLGINVSRIGRAIIMCPDALQDLHCLDHPFFDLCDNSEPFGKRSFVSKTLNAVEADPVDTLYTLVPPSSVIVENFVLVDDSEGSMAIFLERRGSRQR
jgi:hypothetical protein